MARSYLGRLALGALLAANSAFSQICEPSTVTATVTVTAGSNPQPDPSSSKSSTSSASSSSSSVPNQASGSTTLTDGRTVVFISSEGYTIPTGLPPGVTTTTASDGSPVTLTIISTTTSGTINATSTQAPPVYTTQIDGVTIIYVSNQPFTVPSGLTQASTVTTTALNGQPLTLTFGDSPPAGPSSSSTSSSSSSSGALAGLFPVSTSVPAPKPTDDGTEIPCNLWFFSICLQWGDLNILGWKINLPPGIYPPGPPPAISFPPELGISIGITGTLPKWPALTVGPDKLPTFAPKPSDGPDNGCKTQSAELCATSTSYGVSLSGDATITTNSQAVSTCATIYGCEVSDSSTDVTTTTGCTSATTATNYFVSCPNSGTTSCTTTSSATTTGCSVTATTVTCGILTPTGIAADPACSSADTYPYVVYPKDGTNNGQVSDTESKLKAYLSDPSKLYTFSSEGLATHLWTLSLTRNQSEEVAAMDSVASVNDFCGDTCTYDPTTAMNYQDQDIPGVEAFFKADHLPHLSWAYQQVNNPWPQRYFFDDSAGSGIKTYVFDTGATMSHPEFELLRPRVKWIQVGTGNEAGEDDGTPGAHGSAMLSLVAGKYLGVAKNVDPIIVRVPGRGGSPFNTVDWLQGLGKIRDDLAFDSTAATSVILLAAHWDRSYFALNGNGGSTAANGFEAQAALLLGELVKKGAILATGAGNSDQNPSGVSDGWPSNLGKPNNQFYIPSLLVAGSTSVDGGKLYGLTDPANSIPNVYAPGLDLSVADGNTNNWKTPISTQFQYRYSRGTSDAAALTTGLAAYFLKLIQLGSLKGRDGNLVGNTPQNVKDFITKEAWSRRLVNGQDRPAIWNEADLKLPACPWNPKQPAARLFRRQSPPPGSCYTPAATSGQSSTSSSGTTTSISSSGTTTTSSTSSDSSSIFVLPGLPTLTTGIVTPSGSSCVSTTTATMCALGVPPGVSACAGTPVCASWQATATSTTAAAPPPTASTLMTVSIYKDTDCTDLLEKKKFTFSGDCYSPVNSDGNPQKFKCFQMAVIGQGVPAEVGLTAFKGVGCFSQDQSDREEYTSWRDLVSESEAPFDMESLSLSTF